MKIIGTILTAVLLLTGCATMGGEPLTPEQKAIAAKAAVAFVTGRVQTAQNLGLINSRPITEASPAALFFADTACAGLRALMLRRPDVVIPAGQGPFCKVVEGEIIRRAMLPPT